MAKKIREFMTHREPAEHIWMERDESAVIGTARMGQKMVPKIRPFDLLRNAPLAGNRARVMIFEGDGLRVATEHIDGCEAQLTRAADHDVIYLQFCGRSKIESDAAKSNWSREKSRWCPRLFRIAQPARISACACTSPLGSA